MIEIIHSLKEDFESYVYYIIVFAKYQGEECCAFSMKMFYGTIRQLFLVWF